VKPRGAVVVPAFDEAALLPRFLASVARQQPPQQRVALLLCANNCRDATAQIARGWQERLPLLGPVVVESVVTPPNVGRVRAEAAQGALAAGCAWLAFVDADGELPDADFVRRAETLAEDGPELCFAGPSDEFADARRALHACAEASGVAPGSPADRLLAFGSAFRCFALPRDVPAVRYTDGSNSLVGARAYAACGGFGERRVGGDSLLGDRYLRHTGRPPEFFDRAVHTSCRKPFAMGRPGGFVFYPAGARALPAVRRDADPRALGRIDPARAFETICDDLRALLCFSLRKRRAWLRSQGLGAAELAAAVARAAQEFAREHDAPLELEADGESLRVLHRAPSMHRTLALDQRSVERFWQTGA
jgi:glycosyltransferase involved in cell wall biosynthesis